MPLTFHPGAGVIVICDFGTGFRPPEMVKVRPVVILSPRRRSSQLVTVVPLSSVSPTPPEPWHHQLAESVYPPARSPMWAKCDMVLTVALTRLDRVRGKDAIGRRVYFTPQLSVAEMTAIRTGVKAALGLS